MQQGSEEFDAFYKAARGRLLVQTYALTGDLPASRSAVRDAFVAAWHHWRKVSRLEDPESWVRPHAWQHAQRRHTARIWHRDKSLDADSRATLDALAKLSLTQRKVLLLTQLSSASMQEMAREVGLTDEAAERELQTATSRFATQRDVPSTSVRGHLTELTDRVNESRFPRPSIIRRAGAARRRAHTGTGVAAAVVALFLGGAVVHESGGVAPDLNGASAQGATVSETAGAGRDAAARGHAGAGAGRPALPHPHLPRGPDLRQHRGRRHQLDLPAGPLRRPRRPRGPGPDLRLHRLPGDDGDPDGRAVDVRPGRQARLQPHRRLVHRLPRRPGAAAHQPAPQGCRRRRAAPGPAFLEAPGHDVHDRGGPHRQHRHLRGPQDPVRRRRPRWPRWSR